ncbi:MAG: glycine cleavage system protein H, partial [Thiotrichales bacterium]|nr:glycine cleavage system protein H [Thiotrichales bacterium]
LEDEPEIVTEDSMGEGWFIKVKLSNPEELNDLLDEDAYNKFIED